MCTPCIKKMEQPKKKRGVNWTPEEKDILRQLIAESAKILEDKSTKTNVNMLKIQEWKNVTNKLNEIVGKNRSVEEIKLAWKRLKLAAKANLSHHRREQSITGGGNKPPSPSPEDLAIMAIAPHDFVVDVIDYDSDAIITNRTTTIVEDPNVDVHSSKNPCVMIVSEENEDCSIKEKQVIYTSEAVETKSSVEIEDNKQKNRKKGKTANLNINAEGRQAIINSNADFKKRQLDMLEVGHSYDVEISKLKIKKLQLQIQLLETEIKTNTSTKE